MRPGTAQVRGTVPGFLLFGMSWQHLWFKSDSRRVVKNGPLAGDDYRLLRSREQCEAFQCFGCRITVLRQ